LLGGLDQAFQYIQEYSGFIYPGIITVFGLGLLWKRASSKAAVWTAILTIPMGVLFKVILPDLAFQFRAGYIFIILVCFFILVSYLDNKFVSCELPSDEDCSKMNLWAKVLGSAGLIMIVAALIIILMGDSTSVTAYLNDIGVQAFIFFGVLVGCNAVWLHSNAIDRKRDEKALPINLSLFATTRGYTYGTIGIAVITILLYAVLW
jgi:SSS family solute:Na+ symporter